MANKTIVELTLDNITGEEQVPVWDVITGTTKKTTVQTIVDKATSSSTIYTDTEIGKIHAIQSITAGDNSVTIDDTDPSNPIIIANMEPQVPQVQSDWDATEGLGEILNKPTLFSGDYDDLSNKPTIQDGSKWEDIPAATTLHPRWDDSGRVSVYGTDKFKFNALPSGYRGSNGTFLKVGEESWWWQSNLYSTDYNGEEPYSAYFYKMDFDGNEVMNWFTDVRSGFSIRCIRAANTAELLQPDGTINLIAASDSDGNTYSSTKIGTQVWIRENLRTTTYNNGDPIPTNLSNAAWSVNTSGAMAVYGKAEGEFVPVNPNLDDEAKMVAAYGRLYNWHAVNNVKGLRMATGGFVVAMNEEWTTLTNYLISQGITQGVTVGYNHSNDQIINSWNVGDALKSIRQVNSPFINNYIKPKDNKRIDASIIDNLPVPVENGNFLEKIGTNRLIVSGIGTYSENKLELQIVYANAKLIGGLSATNRVTIAISPGIYSGGSIFSIDTPYIDICSLTGNKDVILDGIDVATDSVIITGINCLTNAFKIKNTSTDLYIENCKGGEGSFGYSSTSAVSISNSTFINCIGGNKSFCCSNTLAATSSNVQFINCTAAKYSFCASVAGSVSDTGSTFTECVSTDEYSFGACETLGTVTLTSSIFTRCKSSENSFGSCYTTNIITSNFYDCESDLQSFGCGHDVTISNSLFKDCVNNRWNSFGMGQDVIITDSEFINCISKKNDSFGHGMHTITITNTKFIDCTSCNQSFGHSVWPNELNEYPYTIITNCIFTNCISGFRSFGYTTNNVTITNSKFYNCISYPTLDPTTDHDSLVCYSFGVSSYHTTITDSFFIGCISSHYSFGYGFIIIVTNSIFRDCISKYQCFLFCHNTSNGGSITSTNTTFTNCSAGGQSFCNNNIFGSSIFYGCKLLPGNTFNVSGSSILVSCINGDNSIITTTKNIAPTTNTLNVDGLVQVQDLDGKTKYMTKVDFKTWLNA